MGVCYAPISKVVELTLPAAKAAAGAIATAVSGDAIATSPFSSAIHQLRRIPLRNC